MFQIKPISKDSIPSALEKAERYRLLNEPMLAESICLDILDADPSNNDALVTMVLAITDQFTTTSSLADINEAKQFVSKLSDEYDRQYYLGLIHERQGNAVLNRNNPDSVHVAYEWIADAMEHYEKAEAIRPPGKDDAILRWNTCARLIMRHHLQPRDEKYFEQQLE
jgi:hypothetical protein